MNRIVRSMIALAMMASIPTLVCADDQDVIDYREHIMNTLNAQTLAIGQILSGAIPPDNAAAHIETIALTAATALKSFEAKVPGGEAKPEVWSNWPDFSKRMNEFVQKTAAMAKIAKEQGAEAAMGGVLDALTCKACHEVYRDEKQRKK